MTINHQKLHCAKQGTQAALLQCTVKALVSAVANSSSGGGIQWQTTANKTQQPKKDKNNQPAPTTSTVVTMSTMSMRSMMARRLQS